jgi:uncharacterized protein (TIGR03435 family)
VRGIILLAAVAALLGGALHGVAQAARGEAAAKTESALGKVPAFAVVSVKPAQPGVTFFRSQYTPSGISATNAPLQMLLRQAYGLMNSNDDQFTGLPARAKAERFDIEAKVDPADVEALHSLSMEQRGLMLQALLADRFKMVAHREARELPIYELVVAKGGSKLKEATPGDTYPNGIKGPDGRAGAGMMNMRPGHIQGQAVQMQQIASILTQMTGRTVQDKTGLTGKYDVTLDWTPDDGPPPMLNGVAVDGPSIFTAVQEQLGLKLDPGKGMVDGVVIDHIERPTPN